MQGQTIREILWERQRGRKMEGVIIDKGRRCMYLLKFEKKLTGLDQQTHMEKET